MNFRETVQWLDTCVEVYPTEAITNATSNSPPIEALHVEGGVVEVSDTKCLEPLEMKISLLGALGLAHTQIAETLFYSTRGIEWHQKNAFKKLGIDSKPGRNHGIQAVNELFRQHRIRVTAPIYLPDLDKYEHAVFQSVANGHSLDEACPQLGIPYTKGKWAITKLRKKLDVSDMQRGILLGHMGNQIDNPSVENITSEEKDGNGPFALRVTTNPDSPETIEGKVDYLEWQDGVISIKCDTRLDAAEQQYLLLGAISTSVPQAARRSSFSEFAFNNARTIAQRKLSARNISHALKQAVRAGELIVTRPVETISLARNESLILDAMSSGLTQEEAAKNLGMDLYSFRYHTYNIFEKLGVKTMAAAVLKRFMSEDPGASKFRDTSAA